MKQWKIFFIISVLTGLLIGVSIKEKAAVMSPYTSEKTFNQKREIDVIMGQIKTNKEIIEELEKEIKINNISKDPITLKEELKNQIENLELISGETGIIGDGIEIIVDDANTGYTSGTNLGVIHDIDLSIIINDLRANGAEAISLNDVRVMENSDIKCGGPIVVVSGISKGTPFVIRAIGDQDMLSAYVYQKNSYVSILQDVYGILVKISKRNNIKIPRRVK